VYIPDERQRTARASRPYHRTFSSVGAAGHSRPLPGIQETCFRLRQRMKAAAQVPGSGMGVMVLMLLPTCSRPKKPPGASGLANCSIDPD